MATHNVNLTPKELKFINSNKVLSRQFKILQNMSNDFIEVVTKGAYKVAEERKSLVPSVKNRAPINIDLMGVPVNDLDV